MRRGCTATPVSWVPPSASSAGHALAGNRSLQVQRHMKPACAVTSPPRRSTIRWPPLTHTVSPGCTRTGWSRLKSPHTVIKVNRSACSRGAGLGCHTREVSHEGGNPDLRISGRVVAGDQARGRAPGIACWRPDTAAAVAALRCCARLVRPWMGGGVAGTISGPERGRKPSSPPPVAAAVRQGLLRPAHCGTP